MFAIRLAVEIVLASLVTFLFGEPMYCWVTVEYESPVFAGSSSTIVISYEPESVIRPCDMSGFQADFGDSSDDISFENLIRPVGGEVAWAIPFKSTLKSQGQTNLLEKVQVDVKSSHSLKEGQTVEVFLRFPDIDKFVHVLEIQVQEPHYVFLPYVRNVVTTQ